MGVAYGRVRSVVKKVSENTESNEPSASADMVSVWMCVCVRVYVGVGVR